MNYLPLGEDPTLVVEHVERHVLRNSSIGVFAGIAILLVGIYWLRIGRVWDNIYGWSSREEKPVIYWIELTSIFIIAGILIVTYGLTIIKYISS